MTSESIPDWNLTQPFGSFSLSSNIALEHSDRSCELNEDLTGSEFFDAGIANPKVYSFLLQVLYVWFYGSSNRNVMGLETFGSDLVCIKSKIYLVTV